ncbi:hypothetical protein [Ochrobactrum sp. AN78]|uniref:hypothetical protein n=1 Tax=Ochrobactrum sp. AN78 TaxID=3039853 RepID=UPI002989D1D1|nr:hypothetical protein [Ochrobactrum sp. AN78]MDH7790711.1 hypothetical protein [Ochrobactrum sp. AN78]
MITLHDKLNRVEKIIREKQWWLGDFSSGRNKRPDLEIADKREDVRILSAIAGDIRAGIARRAAEGEAA